MLSSIAIVFCAFSVVLINAQDVTIPKSFFFHETFSEDPFSSGKWVMSKNEKYANQPVKIQAPKNPLEGFENDKGMVLTQEMKYYGVSSKFPVPLNVKGKDLVIQYELKLEDTLSCGGAYVKLPRVSDDLNLDFLDNDTPYTIMFGPDRCGSNNKVHFILQHQSPKTHLWEEKHFNETTPIKNDHKFHLYTLSLKSADQSFDIYVDKKKVKSGNLMTHMTPSVNPDKEIDDPTDLKPEDWVDEAKMDDPTAVKPDDWDESQPKMILNEKATKPEGWLDAGPEKIPDPSASKPDDWDDEEDGEWEAPEITNPVCDEIGCGEWKQPMMSNPLYKGKWSAPKIDNPAYKGPWFPRKIANPDYFFDPRPADMAPMAGIAVEVWTTNAGIFFDNFVIGDSLGEAFAFADSTYKLKQEIEDKKEKTESREKKKREREDKKKNGEWLSVIEAAAGEYIDMIVENPYALGISVVAIIVAGILLAMFPTKKPKKKASAQVRAEVPPTPPVEAKVSESSDDTAKSTEQETVPTK